MGAIFIEANRASLGSRYLNLVFENDAGTEFVIQGSRVSGQLTTRVNAPLQQTLDARPPFGEPDDRGQTRVLVGSRDADDVWRSLVTLANEINSQNPGVRGANSNITISYLLRLVGLDPEPLIERVQSEVAGRFRVWDRELSFDFQLNGTQGNDLFHTGRGDQQVEGLGGWDTIDGGRGDDTLWGGEGFDQLTGGSGNDSLSGGADSDVLHGGGHNDTLMGGDGNDVLRGGARNDSLEGGAGTDSLYGDGGRDVLIGNDDNGESDTLHGGSGRDTLYAGTDDEVFGDGGHDLLIATEAHSSLDGGGGRDTLQGGDGADELVGGAGNDRISGGDGFDVIFAGAGRDTLTGGDSADFFYFHATGNQGFNIITDFQQGSMSFQGFTLNDTIAFLDEGQGGGPASLDDLEFTDHARGAVVSYRDIDILVRGFSVEQLQNEDYFQFTDVFF